MPLNSEHLKALSAPFDDKTLGVKVQSFSKDRTRASLVCYLQHTDVYVRIESIDPAWKSEILSVDWVSDRCFTRMRLIIHGTPRENVGEGDDPKSSASDAIKRCAMLFGVGRYLYDAATVWVSYNETKDRYRTWTLADYRGSLRHDQDQLPSAESDSLSLPKKRGNLFTPSPPKLTRTELASEIYRVADVIKLAENELDAWVFEVFKKKAGQLMDAELEQFLQLLQAEQGRMGA